MCAATQKLTGTVQSAWSPLTTMPLRTALTRLNLLTMSSYKPIPLVRTWILVLTSVRDNQRWWQSDQE
eukprot:scaffold31967_cov59-Attheya_sp.AAC.1